MKIIWLFPPAEKGGFPNISQYRFYKKMPIRISIIYPYLAASGVTLLDREGFDVKLMDCATMNISWKQVYRELEDAQIVVLEARTPIMFWIWKTCSDLKIKFPNLKIILYGDHVSWNPQESFPYCDYIIEGGNYDLGILDLCKKIRDGWYFKRTYPLISCPYPRNLDFIPFVDRKLVPWNLYYESWRNRDTFFWTMSMRGCYYRCIFCAWTKTFWKNMVYYRSPKNVADEYISLFKEYGECEILDDADCFDVGWGLRFANELISRGYGEEQIFWAIQTHPNMIQNLDDIKLLKKSGLKTVKLGIESLNQNTLNIIKKHTTIKQIEKSIQILKEADIQVHANLMVGFPWESKKEAYETIEFIKKLDPNQSQFSLVIPYPNTELYDIAKSNDWLIIGETAWDQYDASRPMLKMEGLTNEEIIQLYKDCWSKFYLDPKYVWNHIRKIRHWSGVKQLYRGFKSIVFGHMKAVTND